MTSNIKIGIFLAVSLILYFLFITTFNILDLSFILDLSNYASLGISYFLLAGAVSTLTYCIYVNYKKSAAAFLIFILLAIIINLLSFNFLINSIIITLTVIYIFIKSRYRNKNSLSTPLYGIISQALSVVAIMFALTAALSFYLNVQINNQNSQLIEIIDKITQQAVDLNNQMFEDKTNIDIEEQLNNLEIPINENMLMQIQQENEMDFNQLQQNVQADIAEKMKQELLNIIIEYKDYVKLVGALIIFGYLKLIFYILNLILVPILYLVQKALIYFNIFKKEKEMVEVTRVKL